MPASRETGLRPSIIESCPPGRLTQLGQYLPSSLGAQLPQPVRQHFQGLRATFSAESRSQNLLRRKGAAAHRPRSGLTNAAAAPRAANRVTLARLVCPLISHNDWLYPST